MTTGCDVARHAVSWRQPRLVLICSPFPGFFLRLCEFCTLHWVLNFSSYEFLCKKSTHKVQQYSNYRHDRLQTNNETRCQWEWNEVMRMRENGNHGIKLIPLGAPIQVGYVKINDIQRITRCNLKRVQDVLY